MAKYLVRRLGQTVVSLLGILTIVFFVVRLATDPAALYAADSTSPAEYDQIRKDLALDQPLPEQYVRYLGAAARGDFGESWRFHRPALQVVLERLPATLKLAGTAFAISAAFGLVFGVVAATRRGALPDRVVRIVAVVGQAMPTFWLGLLLIMLFSVQLRWLPSGGDGGLTHLLLPAVTLSGFSIAAITRITRSALLDTIRQDYVRTAWAKGLGGRSVLLRHSLRNAWIPILTLMGLQFAALLQGSVVTEQVFSWPGIGSLVVSSIEFRDFPIVQAVVVVGASFYLFINLAVDVCYGFVDPRVKTGLWQR